MILSNPFTQDPRVYNESKSLIKAGHKVTVLGWDKRNENHPVETRDGIDIVRSYNTEFMQLLPYDIFRLHFWWNKGYKDAFELHKKNHFDVVHCHDLDTLSIGTKLKKKFGLPLIYDAHEIWGYMVAKDLPKIWVNYYLQMEKKLIPNVDGFIIAEDKYADYFNKITNKKLTVILNCKHLVSKKYTPPDNVGIFILLYIGILTPPRFLLELTEVVKDLENVKCIIGGVGKQKFVEILKQKCEKVKNIDFLGKIPFNQVIPTTMKSNAVVCMIDPNVFNNKIATANKQFEAMVCGRPIICTKGTRSGDITEREQCGLVIDYNKEALREAIIKLRDSPELCKKLGKNALKAAINKYNWELEEKKLVKIYEKI